MIKEKTPLVSIITVCRNSAATIEDTIKSVLAQTYPRIEYIVVDGDSTDGTKRVIERYRSRIATFISEPDKGIYDAMNKGIATAKGEIVGTLNADDVYADERVIEDVVREFITTGAEVAWGDLAYVYSNDLSRTLRLWRSSGYHSGLFQKGWAPPHPAFFVSRKIYLTFGAFNANLKIAADYELMLRFLERHHVSSAHLSRVLVKMRSGGVSNRNIVNIARANWEAFLAWRMNHLGSGRKAAVAVLRKVMSKTTQFFTR